MLIDSLSDGLMVLDSENRILDFNLAARTWIPNVAIGDSINVEEKLPKTLLQYREYTV
jgi:hypothetical protein